MKYPDNVFEIVINANKSIYELSKFKVQRGIRGKTRSKVDELIIFGVPASKSKDYLKKNYDIDIDALVIPCVIKVRDL